MKTKKNRFSLIGLLVVTMIISILAAIFIPCFMDLMRKKPETEIEIDVTTISVGQPELEIESARFYLVRNWLGYGLIQFKDTWDDRKLDKVFYSNSEIPFDLGIFNPVSGFPGKDIITSDNNSSDWDKWLMRFEQVLKAHAEKQSDKI